MTNPEKLNEQGIEGLHTIGYDALMEVTVRYGIGDSEIDALYPPTLSSLAYHNASHTMRVREATRRLAQIHGLTPYDTELAVTIASAHDVYHNGGEGEKTDEELSAQWLVGILGRAGFSAEDKEIARLAILGTTPLKDTDENFMGQQFLLTEFPSLRSGEIALCVAAADMEAVFAAYGPIVAHDLYKERVGRSTCETVEDVFPLIEFQESQIRFISTYQPLYPELEQLFGGLRNAIVEHHTRLRDDLIAGKITSWNQIIEADCAFAQEFSDNA